MTTDKQSPRGRRPFSPTTEGLEGRQLLATAGANVAVLSAATTDSQSVTVDYAVSGTLDAGPLKFGVYRSADDQLDSDDVLLEVVNADGTAEGTHKVVLPLTGGLPPNPARPYVIVATGPEGRPVDSDDAASFRKHVVGVITHGGVQPDEWRAGVPWQMRMAQQMQSQGYDKVIAYNWVPQSDDPGAAARQGPRVAEAVAEAVAAMPAGEPVDVHFVGHSEGAVVNSEAVLALNQGGWPDAAEEGYLKVTMLDPHAANNGWRGQQYSVSGGVLGYVARMKINDFQSKAQDPMAFVQDNVDHAEVFYQRTPVSETYGSNNGVYNLWGQVPVRGRATHYDLTAPGISHSGKFGVQDWYRLNVVPTLGDGAPEITGAALSGQALEGAEGVAAGRKAHYVGEAAPGSIVRLLASAAGESELYNVGRTHAGPDGSWRIATSPLAAGEYRVVAVSNVPHGPNGRPSPMKPTAWLGRLRVGPQQRRA